MGILTLLVLLLVGYFSGVELTDLLSLVIVSIAIPVAGLIFEWIRLRREAHREGC